MTSLGLGVGVGVLYGIASYLTVRWAARYDDDRFMLIFLGGMATRLFVGVAVVTLVLVLLEVQVLPFVGAFVFIVLGSLLAEVWFVHRKPH